MFSENINVSINKLIVIMGTIILIESNYAQVVIIETRIMK